MLWFLFALRIYPPPCGKEIFSVRMVIGRKSECFQEGERKGFFLPLCDCTHIIVSAKHRIASMKRVKSSFLSFLEWKVKLNWKIIGKCCEITQPSTVETFKKSIRSWIELKILCFPFRLFCWSDDCNILFEKLLFINFAAFISTPAYRNINNKERHSVKIFKTATTSIWDIQPLFGTFFIIISCRQFYWTQMSAKRNKRNIKNLCACKANKCSRLT